MVENVNGNNGNAGKVWTKIISATTDSEYLKGLDAKVNSIMKGKSTVSAEKIMKDSVFADMDAETKERFNKIAKLDGDVKSFTKDELRVLYALADAKLVDNSFKFDLKWDNTKDSALKEATSKVSVGNYYIGGEMELVVANLTVNGSAERHISKVDTSKFSKTKPLAEKLKSDNPDEVMNAINNEIMTNYVNPETGKKMPITEVTSLVSKYVSDNEDMDYGEICKNVKEKYGIPMSDYVRYGDGDDYYTIGDWKIDSQSKTISNEKTGQSLSGLNASWSRNTFETIPNVQGFVFMIDTYSDKDGNVIKFKTQKEVDTIQPSGATVYGPNGSVQQVKYDIAETVDPSLYGFVPKE